MRECVLTRGVKARRGPSKPRRTADHLLLWDGCVYACVCAAAAAVRALQLGLTAVPRVDPRVPRSLDQYTSIYREW